MEAILDWLAANQISILNGIARGLLLFLVASGLSLIFGLMDVLNLAHGAVFLLGAYLAFQVAPGGEAFLLAAAVAVVAGLAFGGLLNAAVTPVAKRGHLAQVLVTLGLTFVFRDVARLIWGTQPRGVRPPAFLQGSTEIFGQFFPIYRLAVIVFGLVVAAGIYVVFSRTNFGAVVRAMVTDAEMVAAMGINTKRVQLAVYCIGSGLAALGGMLAAPLVSIAPGLDDEFLMFALIIVIVGGLGSLAGAFVAALLVGQVQTTLTAAVPEVAGFLLFGTMAFILLVRPQGLFGKVSRAH